jgi:two-component system, OmpR family, sensor histidine kinase KdpD
MTFARPSPESFLRLIQRDRRGRLKVYLGYGPGVGKTYEMLLEAHRLKEQGVDVVVGYVESHGRADTASLLLGLEAIPRRATVYRGVRLEEMDAEALVARRPEVALVDELAHTNVPGSRHAKRFEDVEEILDAGINVITTVNVQHLESLYDTVERLVGVRVKERVPDWVVAEADQIVNVDVSTEDLIRRLEEGKVYPAERVPAALANFFRPAHLEQLRGLTLREAASQLERKWRTPSAPADPAPDQLVVCLSSKGPDAMALLRYGSRLAGRLDRTWYALYVQTPREEPTRIDAATQRHLGGVLELAHQLGATVFTYKGSDVAATILGFAREYRAGHIVVGRAGRRSWWRRLVAGASPVDELLARAEGFTVVVVDPHGGSESATPAAETEPAPAAVTPARRPRSLLEVLPAKAVVVFDEPVGKRALFAALVHALAHVAPALDEDEAVRHLLRREEQGSTFLEEGIGIPHARLARLDRPWAALGVLRGGVTPEGGESPPATIAAVVLLLCPDRDPGGCLELLARCSRLFGRGALRRRILAAGGSAAIHAALREAEEELLAVGSGASA